jgi:hemerythrin-like metal-binding protein
MAAINWSESLSVGIDSIDYQHKKLLDIINSFYENIYQGSMKEKLVELINEMKLYTVFHFKSEERQMTLCNYPDFENHKMEHDKFIAAVEDFEERYKNGKLLLTIEVTNFVKVWISNHIMGTDQKYSDSMIRKGIR